MLESLFVCRSLVAWLRGQEPVCVDGAVFAVPAPQKVLSLALVRASSTSFATDARFLKYRKTICKHCGPQV